MSERLFTPKEAARIADIPFTQLQGWLQRSVFTFATHEGHRRPRFDKRGLRILAVMRELAASGISPNIAARWAATVVDRAKEWPLVAIFSRDPKVSPCLIPEDAMPATDAVIMVSLGPIFRRIDEAIGVV